MSCRSISMPGWSIAMIGDRFKAAGAVADPDPGFIDALPLTKEKFIAA